MEHSESGEMLIFSEDLQAQLTPRMVAWNDAKLPMRIHESWDLAPQGVVSGSWVAGKLAD